ncbi:hypothetical protein J1782_00795, partial [Rahnella sp. BCC 1045]|uniref:hypothetical protein n=1 Tax=Rahnella sp. BCC 1045 TaxID=2816251 RepID=UPI001C27CCBC
SVLFFQKTNVIKPDFINKELSFLRLISWLYTIYFETGKLSLNTINKSMGEDEQKKFKEHKKVVQNFRTFLQHNIDISLSTREFKLVKDCSAWTKKSCDKNIPVTEDDWMKASEVLIAEAYEIFNIVLATLEAMTDSSSKKDIFIINWNITVNKNVPVHWFDTHISKLIGFIDVDSFDVVAYRDANLEAWRKYISTLDAKADYELEIKKIVESSIIRDFIHIIPITIDMLENNFYLSKEFFKSLYEYLDRQQLCSDCNASEILTQIKELFPEYIKL